MRPHAASSCLLPLTLSLLCLHTHALDVLLRNAHVFDPKSNTESTDMDVGISLTKVMFVHPSASQKQEEGNWNITANVVLDVKGSVVCPALVNLGAWDMKGKEAKWAAGTVLSLSGNAIKQHEDIPTLLWDNPGFHFGSSITFEPWRTNRWLRRQLLHSVLGATLDLLDWDGKEENEKDFARVFSAASRVGGFAIVWLDGDNYLNRVADLSNRAKTKTFVMLQNPSPLFSDRALQALKQNSRLSIVVMDAPEAVTPPHNRIFSIDTIWSKTPELLAAAWKSGKFLETLSRVTIQPARAASVISPEMHSKGSLQALSDADIVVFDFSEDGKTAVVRHLIVGGMVIVKDGVEAERSLQGLKAEHVIHGIPIPEEDEL